MRRLCLQGSLPHVGCCSASSRLLCLCWHWSARQICMAVGILHRLGFAVWGVPFSSGVYAGIRIFWQVIRRFAVPKPDPVGGRRSPEELWLARLGPQATKKCNDSSTLVGALQASAAQASAKAMAISYTVQCSDNIAEMHIPTHIRSARCLECTFFNRVWRCVARPPLG